MKTKPEPRELADYVDYVAAQKRLAELQSRRVELKAKLDVLPDTAAGREQETISQKARDVLAGKKVGLAQPTATELAEKAKVLDQAIKIAKNAVGNEQRKASAAICEDQHPKRRQLVTDVIDALDSLVKAWAAVDKHADELRVAGVQGDLPVPLFRNTPHLAKILRTLAAGNEMQKIIRNNKRK